MRIMPTAQYGNLELSDCEAQLVDLVNGYQEQIAVIAALRKFCNAEKVLQTLRLWGKFKKPHASYTLYPIISQIGERTPEQYIVDVDRAVRDYWTQYLNEHPEIAKFYRVKE